MQEVKIRELDFIMHVYMQTCMQVGAKSTLIRISGLFLFFR
jgi:hypothetical protein